MECSWMERSACRAVRMKRRLYDNESRMVKERNSQTSPRAMIMEVAGIVAVAAGKKVVVVVAQVVVVVVAVVVVDSMEEALPCQW